MKYCNRLLVVMTYELICVVQPARRLGKNNCETEVGLTSHAQICHFVLGCLADCRKESNRKKSNRKKRNRKKSNSGEVEKITGKKICKID